MAQDEQAWKEQGQGYNTRRPNERGAAPTVDNRTLREHQQLQVEFARAQARAEQQAAQASALFALSQSVAVNQDLDDLRQAIVEALYEALRADTTSLFLHEDDGRLRMVAQRNIDITRARIVFGPDEGLIALAMRESRVVHVPDTAASTHYLATGADRPRSLLAIPLFPHSGATYVLCVVRRRVYAFTDDEVQFATIMASMAAQALGNATIFHQMQRMALEQSTLYEIAQAAMYSDSVRNFAGRAIDALARALNATGCAVAFVRSRLGEHIDAEPIVAPPLSPLGRARCHAFVAELEDNTAAATLALRCTVGPRGERLILVPIVVRSEPVAVIGWETRVLPSGLAAPISPPIQAIEMSLGGPVLTDTQAPEDDDPARGQWGASRAHEIPTLPGLPPLPLSAEEASFIANVAQQLALGIENLLLRARDLNVLRSLSALPASRPHLDQLRREIVREVEQAFAPAGVALLLRESDGPPRVAATTANEGAGWLKSALTLAEEAQPTEFLQRRGIALAALVADFEPFGWLALRQPGPTRLSADRALLFTSLAGAAALLLHNARLHLMAREAAVDRERQRIAREIHDGVAQNLAHLLLRLELIDRLIPGDPTRARTEALAAREVLFTSLNDLRQSIAALAPAQLEQLGFTGAVQAILDDIATNTPGLTVEFVTNTKEDIPPELRIPAFRIVQEALTNIRKHAQAHHAWVTVELIRGRALHIEIRDDGRGFTTDPATVPTGHFGLVGMRERASEFGGHLTLTSAPGAGTTISVTLPLALAA